MGFPEENGNSTVEDTNGIFQVVAKYWKKIPGRVKERSVMIESTKEIQGVYLEQNWYPQRVHIFFRKGQFIINDKTVKRK